MSGRNQATGYEADFESNAFGIYTARELVVGTYTMSVEATGFKTLLRNFSCGLLAGNKPDSAS
jgi:hypothetical protein